MNQVPVGAGSDKIEAVSFRVSGGFMMRLGSTEKKIEVPRLSFKVGEEVIRVISSAMSQDAASAVQVVAMGYERSAKGADPKAYDALSRGIEVMLKKILEYKLYGMLSELLTKVSMGTISKELIDDMQFSEVANALTYLLNENLAPLKNLFASLEAITSSEK